jgi:hypothetical protein
VPSSLVSLRSALPWWSGTPSRSCALRSFALSCTGARTLCHRGLLCVISAADAGYEMTKNPDITPQCWRSILLPRRRRCREHRLGTCVEADRHRSHHRRGTQPYSAAEWCDDRGRVALRVYRRPVGIIADSRVVKRHCDNGVFAKSEPDDLFGRPQPCSRSHRR